jgi:hypothetical protein
MSEWRADGWLAIALAGAAGTTIVESALIERRFALFRGGFLAPEHLETAGQRITFLLLSGLADLVVVGVLAGITLWLASRWGLSAVPRRVLALIAGVAPLALADLVSYELLAYVGGAFDLSLMWDLVGRQPREFLAVGAAHLAEPLWLIASASALIAALVWLLQRWFPGTAAAPHRRGPAVMTLVLLVVLGSVAVTAGATLSEPVAAGLRRKPSARAMAIVVNRLSDVDRDGYGVGARPADANPFDAKVHPYAVDLPGTGVDEDGIGGDLPVADAAYSEGATAAPAWGWKPDVIVVLLESVRADVLDTMIDGRPATPTLRGIAAAGGAAPLAFSHNGFTYQSRYHLFSGSLAGVRGGRTLVDDFKSNGYRVGYFSGQDDSFGGPELAVGFDRADTFFDARSAPDRRYTQFSTPGSLAVPASVVLEKASGFVAAADRDVPMFLYVNFHDTHYPYHYRGIQPLISPAVLEPGEIGPARGVELRAMYMNTVANVDQAIGTLIAEVTRLRGRAPSVIVTSDHGESLFDEGFLGHGYALNDAQTRVPFVTQGLPLQLPQPFGQVEVRQAIWNALAGPSPADARPDFSRTATAPVFQYLGSVDQPREIGRREPQGGRTLYDFRADRAQSASEPAWVRPDRLTDRASASFLALVRNWEAMMLARAGTSPAQE